MTRDEILIQLINLKSAYNAISVVTMGAIPGWSRLGGDERMNIPVTGMGLASSVGLGLALARPDKIVMVIDGDGSLLMELGVLPVIGHYAPENYHHFVMVNNEYETTGHQPLPSVDWLGLADNCGLLASPSVPYRLAYQGPYLYPLVVERAEPEEYPDIDPEGMAQRLRKELADEMASVTL